MPENGCPPSIQAKVGLSIVTTTRARKNGGYSWLVSLAARKEVKLAKLVREVKFSLPLQKGAEECVVSKPPYQFQSRQPDGSRDTKVDITAILSGINNMEVPLNHTVTAPPRPSVPGKSGEAIETSRTHFLKFSLTHKEYNTNLRWLQSCSISVTLPPPTPKATPPTPSPPTTTSVPEISPSQASTPKSEPAIIINNGTTSKGDNNDSGDKLIKDQHHSSKTNGDCSKKERKRSSVVTSPKKHRLSSTSEGSPRKRKQHKPHEKVSSVVEDEDNPGEHVDSLPSVSPSIGGETTHHILSSSSSIAAPQSYHSRSYSESIGDEESDFSMMSEPHHDTDSLSKLFLWIKSCTRNSDTKTLQQIVDIVSASSDLFMINKSCLQFDLVYLPTETIAQLLKLYAEATGDHEEAVVDDSNGAAFS